LERLSRIGMVARWRPVHLGHQAILRALCEAADHAVIGIGSSNRYDLRNPFTAGETADMIRLVLDGRDNYRLLEVPDLDDGPRWRQLVLSLFSPLDLFVTENPYVEDLLSDDFPIRRPIELVDPADRLPIDGTAVRRAMARGDSWQRMVPEPIARYLMQNGLDRRFRAEFGLETLALEAPYVRPVDAGV
jgi:nicotinamide-nucleotide adenylyltransferase